MKKYALHLAIMTVILIFLGDSLKFTDRTGRLKGDAAGLRAEESDSPYELDEDGIARILRPATANDPCEMSDFNIQRAMAAIVKEKPGGPAAKMIPWNKKSAPRFMKVVNARFALDDRDWKMLRKNGFVVPDKTRMRSYGYAYHEIYQSEMPLYVTADSILNALFLSNDAIIKKIEIKVLIPSLRRILTGIASNLRVKKAEYPAEAARDIDLYCAVALSLLENRPASTMFGADGEVKEFYERAMNAKSLEEVELWGRKRMIDFTQYTPRGHYADDELAGYFRCALWLSRLEFNIVSRSCKSSHPGNVPDPGQTPREIRAALLLAEISAAAGIDKDIEIVENSWSVFAGRREDMSLHDLNVVRTKAGVHDISDPKAPEAIIRAIGDSYKRTVNTHYMPEGTRDLPVICTLIGPRITADSGAFSALIDPAVPGRHMIGAADAAYVLGSDRSRSYLADEIKKFPGLTARLDESRKKLSAGTGGADLYSLWLAAIAALGKNTRGVLPSMMRSGAYADLRVNSTVAAFAQIRHNYVLMAAQNYDFGGCRIPDAFVEPAPDLYDALISYGDRGAAALKKIDPSGSTGAEKYLTRFSDIVRVVRAIVECELANRPLTKQMKIFLSQVAELRQGGTGGPPTYTGWYFDLFFRRGDALNDSFYIADFYTSTYLNKIAYAGDAGLNLGIFVIDVCGAPRLAVGPVARSFEYTGPLEKRLDDKSVEGLRDTRMPWSAAYTSYMATPEPKVHCSSEPDYSDKPGQRILIYSPEKLGAVTMELLDHNRRRIAAVTKNIGPGKTVFTCALPRENNQVDLIHFKKGDYNYWSGESQMGMISFTLGGCPVPEGMGY